MKTLRIKTDSRDQFVDITQKVADWLSESGYKEGIVHIFVPHTTAGVTINEGADPSVREDMLAILDKNIPWEDGYKHLEGNSAAHMKASLMGSSVQIPVVDGEMQLGTWQSIYFAEFDGPRERKVYLKVFFQ